jgi:hypothetical protein
MATSTYELVLSTPMGNLDGSATLTADGTTLSGSLSFMGGSHQFTDGTLDADGNLTIKGEAPMPMGSMQFTIVGTLIDGVINAVAKTAQGDIPIRSK